MNNPNVPPKSKAPKPSPKQPIILDVDAVTLTAIVAALIFIPLILSGFLFQ
ncbi:MAG: hypothetical protein ACO3NK_00080 [Prochlorotrichaceae cyanobacterium]|jgi:hypothetical protein